MNKIGFLFDLDGVLIDSENTYTRIWTEIDRQFPTGVDNFAHAIKGTTLDSILSKYYPSPDIQKQVISVIEEKESAMEYDYTPGAFRMLSTLREENVPTALFTSSDDKKMSHLWAQHPELKSFLDVIVLGVDVKKSKPDPEGYLMAADALGVKTSNCVVFEDSLQGVKAGRSSGAYVVGVAGTLPKECIAPYSDIVVDTLEDIDIHRIIEILSAR